MAIGCETCRWQVGHYCEKPGGNNCDWEKEMFGRGKATWSDYEPRRPQLKSSVESKTPDLKQIIHIAEQLVENLRKL